MVLRGQKPQKRLRQPQKGDSELPARPSSEAEAALEVFCRWPFMLVLEWSDAVSVIQRNY